ncbi:MAG: 1-deoxy-D-xylulose-5-phosphate reductoisomerase [Deltaproteobacteria bacterium]|nr:MAG: 1-deoxy-D-xylulose-5-phosphate reductoisomerase [Deltaproteobacteria bacterium]
MKNLAILGSTGSIGRNALAVVAQHPEEFAVLGLGAGKNVRLLAEQISRFRPARVSVQDADSAAALAQLLPDQNGLEILVGTEGAMALATDPQNHLVVSAMVGAVGLQPTLAALEHGIPVALANKETLVMAGPLVMAAARRQGITIIPIDSEHSAIFQSLQGHRPQDIRRLWLTASGGPFLHHSREQLTTVTPAQALNHPNWSMGPKITVDSATMINKGLEVIEASMLFQLPPEQIAVHIHPQSIIHSLVEYIDGSVIAQLGIPDMRVPIAYALAYPRRLPLDLPPLDLFQVGQLTFEPPDLERFPSLGLAFAAARTGGTAPAVLNAANEVAVAAFLAEKLPFLGICQIIAQTLKAHQAQALTSLDQVLRVDRWAREFAHNLISPPSGADALICTPEVRRE